MKTLLIFNREPDDNTDVSWIGLRLADKLAQGVVVKVCDTCMACCGIYRNHSCFNGAEKSIMQALADWVVGSDKVISFSVAVWEPELAGGRQWQPQWWTGTGPKLPFR
jgi:uncharacterized protein involved in oxidation of intracellular sulfur